MMRDHNRLPIAPRFEIYHDPKTTFWSATFLLLDLEAVERGRATADDDYTLYVGLFDRKRDAVRVARRIIRGEGA